MIGPSTLNDRKDPVARLVMGVLVAAVAVSGVLAYQAYAAVRSHQAAAQRAVRDYAAFAAYEFAQHATSAIQHPLHMVFTPMRSAVGKMSGVARVQKRGDVAASAGARSAIPISSGLLSPATFLDTARVTASPTCDCVRLSGIRSAVTLDFRTGGEEVAGRPAEDLTWMRTAVGAHATRDYDSMRDVALLVVRDPSGTPHTLGYRVVNDERGELAGAHIVELAPDAFRASLARVVERQLLLPPSLTDSMPNDSLMTIAVGDSLGRTLFTTAASTSEAEMQATGGTGVATERLPAALGALTVTVTIRPEVAPTLVIGGLPRTRLPLLLFLFALTCVLAAIGIVQLRRGAELSRLRTDFVAGVSHELRTPLAQISMFAETLLLERERSREERLDFLEILTREAKRLTQLVERVLRFARAERGDLALTLVPTDLGLELATIVEQFRPLAHAAGADIACHVPAGDVVVADIDRDAFRQVMLNLLDNAVKYGPPGQTVTVGLVASLATSGRRHGTGTVSVRVDDEGPGVPPQARRRIFDSFYRLPRDQSGAIAGSGIGLALVRDLTLGHAGNVRVTDAPGGGARFVVEIPLRAVEPDVALRLATRGSGVPEIA